MLEKALEKYAQPDLESSERELHVIAGDDWDEIRNDPAQLEAARYTVRTAKQIAAGEVPESYTSTTECLHCGPVSVWAGYPNPTTSCPWCMHRRRSLLIPKGAK